MSKWVLFSNRPAFDIYHAQACEAHGIPKPGKLASDGETVMLDAQWTQAWVNITGAFAAFPGAFLLVQVPDEDVVTYGLTVAPADPKFPSPEDDNGGRITIFYNGADRVVLTQVENWMKPLPPTWTDPNTGIVYDVPGV